MRTCTTSTIQRPAFKRQWGMTMMEIIAVMSIIIAVVVGAVSLFNSVQSNNSAVTVQKDILTIRSAVQQIYIGQGDYSSSSINQLNEQLYNAKTALSTLTWQQNSKTYRTSWNGTLSISTDGNKPQKFKMTLTQVPIDLCAQLASSMANGWESVQVGNKTYKTFPVSPGDANRNCNPNGSTNIIWTTLN